VIILKKKEKKKKQMPSKRYEVLREKFFIVKVGLFIVNVLKDLKTHFKRDRRKMNLYGLTMYAGMQGEGKTVSLVEQLEYIRSRFPDVPICTNFGYEKETFPLDDWNFITETDFKEEYPNGIVIAIDEIQNEFSVYETRNFNMDLLHKITQQRKSGVKIYGTSQHFTRVTKPLRQQTFEVVECKTFLGRWTFQRCFDAQEYDALVENPLKLRKLPRKWRRNFVQSDKLRSMYDSYAVIDRLKKLDKTSK